MTEPTEETNVGLELPTSDEIPVGGIELGTAPVDEPLPYPVVPQSRKALASVLACSEANIRKRLKQLTEFHSMSLLVEPSGKVSVFGCKEVMDLIAQGLDVYRQLQLEASEEPEQPPMGIVVSDGNAVIPQIMGTTAGQGAIVDFAGGLDAYLEQIREGITSEREQLNRRRAEREQALQSGVAALSRIQREQQRLNDARLQDSIDERVTRQVLDALGKLAGVGYGPAQSA